MFGSIVVVLPSHFKGGNLILRHGDKEFDYDYSTELGKERVEGDRGIVGWIAFYSDVDHEVLPVSEGYRVTLTYVCPRSLIHRRYLLKAF